MEIAGKRGKGQAALRWDDKIQMDLKELGAERQQAHDRELWRIIGMADPK